MEGKYIFLSFKDVFFSMFLMLLLYIISILNKFQLEKNIIVGTIRTFIQLQIAAYIIKFIFFQDKWYWVFLMLFIMLSIASFTANSRQIKSDKKTFLYFFLSISISVTLVLVYVFSFVIKIKNFYNPQYLIPLASMTITSAMNISAMAVRNLYNSIKDNKLYIETLLSLGVKPSIALLKFKRESVKLALIPTINSLMTVGLVHFPGMMSGQIIAGANPINAVNYQIVIMYMLAFGAVISSFLAVAFFEKIYFNQRYHLNI